MGKTFLLFPEKVDFPILESDLPHRGETVGWLPIMEKGKPGACHRDWPLFYMNDFSKLGLVVTQLAEALAALRAGGFTVHETVEGSLVEIDEQNQLCKILQVLAQHDLSCEMSDQVSCVYQG
ncbi:MAG: hypothetical protein PHI97_00120 [Desulfobulbus sp.]|nr:hypothetical protein [Desulfobulbus sp.]